MTESMVYSDGWPGYFNNPLAPGQSDAKDSKDDQETDKKNLDVKSGDSPELSSEMTLLEASNYKNAELVKHLKILDASREAELLGFTEKMDLDTVFCKVLERKLEAMQWELFKHAQTGMDLVVLNIADKKNFVKVKVPANVCLPFAGQVSTTASRGSIFFAKVFGISFYVQPRSEGLNSDVVIPAWSSKIVSKACDSFFVQKKLDYQILLEFPSGQKPEGIRFQFVQSDCQRQAIEEQCAKDGSAFCFLPERLEPECKLCGCGCCLFI